jgi:hypothetical protein
MNALKCAKTFIHASLIYEIFQLLYPWPPLNSGRGREGIETRVGVGVGMAVKKGSGKERG